MFRVLRILMIAAALVIVAACGGNRIGYGVVLWSTDEDRHPSGSLVQVIEESRINDTYLIRGMDTKETTELPKHRVSLFKKRKTAAEFIEQYSQYASTAAYVEQDGLPVRDEPSAMGQRVYRLRKNQIIKILNRGTELETEGNLEGYWYKVLTDDGITGYAFSVSLGVFDLKEETSRPSDAQQDPYMEALFNVRWRPEYFQRMVETERIDTRIFTPEISMSVDPDRKQIEITLPYYEETLTYVDIVSMGNNSYRILGTPLEIIFINLQTMELIYSGENKRFSETLIIFDGNIEETLKKEEDRQRSVYREFTRKGTVFTSTAYGTITLREYPSFRWEQFQRLVPEVIPENAENSGTVSFSLFLSQELTADFDGGLTFQFGQPENETASNFLYEIEETGIRLTFIRKNEIEDNFVERVGDSSIILFFAFPEE